MACSSKAAMVLYFFTSSGRLRRALASSAACRPCCSGSPPGSLCTLLKACDLGVQAPRLSSTSCHDPVNSYSHSMARLHLRPETHTTALGPDPVD